MKNSNIAGIPAAALAGLLMLLTAADTARAAVPGLINFQGKLTDPAGKAVTAVVPMKFKLYTAAAGGVPLWTEIQNVTPDNYGVYSVMLGALTPFNLDFSAPYWLGVTVGTDGEMLPRYRLAASAYALKSSTAAWAEGADWPAITNKPALLTMQGNTFNNPGELLWLPLDGKLPALDGSQLTNMVAAAITDGAVTTAKLAANAVTDAKVLLTTGAITSGKFGDDRVAISPGAFPGGLGGSDQLLQLDGAAKVPYGKIYVGQSSNTVAAGNDSRFHVPLTTAAIGSAPNASGLTLSAQQLNLQPANDSFGGVVTTGAQTFAGAKTFSDVLTTGKVGVGAAVPNSTLHVAGSVAYKVTSITASGTLTDADSIVLADPTGGAIDVNLPSAVGVAGRMYTVINTKGTNTVTVKAAGIEVINGAATKILPASPSGVTIVSDGAAWWIMSSY